MSIGLFALSLALVVFVTMNLVARWVCNADVHSLYSNGPTYFFFNAMAFFVFTLSFAIITKQVEDHCVSVVEIGGCNKYACGVRMSDGSIDRMSSPVVGEQKCYNRLEYRFWD